MAAHHLDRKLSLQYPFKLSIRDWCSAHPSLGNLNQLFRCWPSLRLPVQLRTLWCFKNGVKEEMLFEKRQHCKHRGRVQRLGIGHKSLPSVHEIRLKTDVSLPSFIKFEQQANVFEPIQVRHGVAEHKTLELINACVASLVMNSLHQRMLGLPKTCILATASNAAVPLHVL